MESSVCVCVPTARQSQRMRRQMYRQPIERERDPRCTRDRPVAAQVALRMVKALAERVLRPRNSATGMGSQSSRRGSSSNSATVINHRGRAAFRVCMRIQLHVSMYLCTYLCIDASLHRFIDACMHRCTSVSLYSCTHVYMCARTYACRSAFVCMYLCVLSVMHGPRPRDSTTL